MSLDTRPVPGLEEDHAWQQLRGLWRYRWVVLLATVVVVLAVVGVGRGGTPKYSSTAEVLVHTTSTTPVDGTDPTKVLSMPTEVQLAKSDKVAEAVARQVGAGTSAGALLTHLRVVNPPSTTVLRFTVGDRSADRSQQLADAFAQAYLSDREARTVAAVNRLTQVLTDEATSLDQRRASLDDAISKATTSAARSALGAQRALAIDEQLAVRTKLVDARTVDTTPGDVVSPATTPTVRSGPSLTGLVALGLLLGLAVGLAGAWLLGGVRRGHGGTGGSSPIPVLATVPAQRTRSSGARTNARLSGVWRTVLAARFGFGGRDGHYQTLLVVGARKPEPATATAVELATALAGGNRTVAVVEADLRQPSLLSALNVDRSALVESANGWPWQPVSSTGLDGVTLYPADVVTDPRAVLSGERVTAFLRELREQYNHVVVLAPPVLTAIDGLEVLRSVDGVVVAVAQGADPEDVIQASDTVLLGGGTVLGAVEVVARRGFSRSLR